MGTKKALALGALALTLVALGAACGGEGDQAMEATQEDVVNPCGPRGEEAGEEALEGRPPARGATHVEVRATDYAFQGVADRYEPGDYGFTMVNGGREFHEMALVRIKDGEERGLDELLALPEDESHDAYEYVGGTIACPDATAPPLGAKLTGGRYALVCYIPTGFTASASDEEIAERGDNPPHHTKGMTHEFSV